MTQLSAPMAPRERYVIIDIVRGFALFGVLLSNVALTTQFLALPEALREALPTAGIDTVALFLIDALVTEKFFTLFSMLFGLGFAVQLHRATARGANVLPTYSRRLAILFVMGCLHGSLLWFGDVLHIYALLGFVLVLFAGRSDRVVMGWVIAIAALGGAIPFLDWFAGVRGWEYPHLWGAPISATAMYEVLANGSYGEVLRLNWAMHLLDYGQPGFSGWIGTWYVDILWRFLLGFLVGRRMLQLGPQVHAGRLRRWLPWALGVGLLGNGVMSARWNFPAWSIESGLLDALLTALDEVWVLALALSYVGVLVAVYQRSGWDRVLGWLAPVGRMALTNYVAQSLFMMLLFYGLGAGLLGVVGASGCLVLSLAVFGAQILVSRWWLSRFRFGPLEWAWRSMTYGRWQALRAK